MTTEEARRLARQLALYSAKIAARSVSYWLDMMGLKGENRRAVVDAYQHCHDLVEQ